jgi:hypothetical protein
MRGGAPFQGGRDRGDGRSPSSLEATLANFSRYSLSPLVEVLELEEFGFES